MHNPNRPICDHEASPDGACHACNRADGHERPASPKPPPPPELANRVFMRTPPEMAEEIRQSFEEAEYLAAVREIEQTGGVKFEEIIADIERKLHGRN